MKRKVTVTEYFERISWLRDAISDIAISTDLIVGFPGESDQDFEDTITLVKKARFSFAYAFKYSPRKGTAAQRFKDQVPERVKSQRLTRLLKLQDQITIEENQSQIGKTQETLFLYESKKEPGIYYGRTEHFRLIRVKSNHGLVGNLLPVKVTSANKTTLMGTI